jgi:hypothetical protein
VKATQQFTAGPNTYRIDTVPSTQGDTFCVVRCELVALFAEKEQAAFLVDLLAKGGAHHG